jgi:carbon-monoxide dehydrogenase medium subunit
MKPAAFDYVVAHTVPEATAALADAGSQARVLAGGQSLILEMHLQRITPRLVVDINRIPGLDELRVNEGVLHVGALVRHRMFENARSVPGPLGSLFAQAARNIAHPPIRARGTMVGSLGWAHPASEWCAIAVALDADIGLDGRGGARSIPAKDFFVSQHLTTRRPEELITAVRYPLLGDETGVAFVEHRRTHFSFAQAAAAAAITVHDGVISDVRIGLANCADRPVRARNAERSLLGIEPGEAVTGYRLPDSHPFAEAGRIAALHDAEPFAEPYADLEYRRHSIAVVVGRALRQAAEDGRSRAAARERRATPEGDSR